MWPFKKKTKPSVQWSDPLDPHGDGTLRPGDPVFDAMMRGEVAFGNFDDETGWNFTYGIPD